MIMRMKKSSCFRGASAGFSLLEMSVVLIIIGLIVAGILVGKNLQRNSQIRKAISEIQTYAGAVSLFKTQYESLPGDMRNATEIWGSKGGTGSDAACNAISSRVATCNGDGNGFIGDAVTALGVDERPHAWQQLALARMIEGNFTGIMSSPVVVGTEIPKSSMEFGGYWLARISASYPHADPGPSNGIELGRVVANYWPNQGLMTPQEAYEIDRKMDDGVASSGLVKGLESWTAMWPAPSGTCVNGPASSAVGTVQYLTTSQTKFACRISYTLD